MVKRKLCKIICFVVIAVLFITQSECSMFAQECWNKKIYDVSKCGKDTVWSSIEYDGYILDWDRVDGFNWDVLIGLFSKDDDVKFIYNERGQRISKISENDKTYYEYSDDNRLLSVDSNRGSIRYTYEKGMGGYSLQGFSFDNKEYFFVFTDGIISGIKDSDGIIAQYVYDANGALLAVEEYVDGETIINNDESFIGNVNCLRFNESYYEIETGWYYKGRYYDPLNGRYVDGITFEEALAILDETEYEFADVMSRVFSLGCWSNDSRSDVLSTVLENQLDVVTRTIYAEAGYDSNDWHAVAWAIYNRTITPGFLNDAYSVVTDGDNFSSYYKRSREYCNPDTSSAKWLVCLDNAGRLINNQTPSQSVTYITNQVYFKSISSFCSGYNNSGNTDSYYDGNSICDIVLPNYYEIPEGMDKYLLHAYFINYNGRFNVYYNLQ